MATAGPFARHGAALRKLFGEFASMRSRSSGGAERMGMEEFLRFAREHSLCPALLSRVDLLRLAAEAAAAQPAQRGGGAARWAADGAGGSAGADEAAPVAGDDDDGGCVEMTLDFGGFVRSLELSALLLFGGPEWAAQCPTPARKVQLLFFWMDQGSRVFKGNGDALARAANAPRPAANAVAAGSPQRAPTATANSSHRRHAAAAAAAASRAAAARLGIPACGENSARETPRRLLDVLCFGTTPQPDAALSEG